MNDTRVVFLVFLVTSPETSTHQRDAETRHQQQHNNNTNNRAEHQRGEAVVISLQLNFWNNNVWRQQPLINWSYCLLADKWQKPRSLDRSIPRSCTKSRDVLYWAVGTHDLFFHINILFDACECKCGTIYFCITPDFYSIFYTDIKQWWMRNYLPGNILSYSIK